MSRDISTIACAMQALRIVQAMTIKGRTAPMMGDAADVIRNRLGVSRATAYRYVRAAYDAECVCYDPRNYRMRISEKSAQRRADYRGLA
jgi:hypothetical protein